MFLENSTEETKRKCRNSFTEPRFRKGREERGCSKADWMMTRRVDLPRQGCEAAVVAELRQGFADAGLVNPSKRQPDTFWNSPAGERTDILGFESNSKTGETHTWKAKTEGTEQFLSKSSWKGHTADAWASRVEEGRGKLRKGMGSRKQALIHARPNGATRHGSCRAIPKGRTSG